MANLSPEGELQFGADIPSGTINGTEVDQSAVPLSALEQGEFCLSPGFRETSREREEEGLVGLYCDVCKEQVGQKVHKLALSVVCISHLNLWFHIRLKMLSSLKSIALRVKYLSNYSNLLTWSILSLASVQGRKC